MSNSTDKFTVEKSYIPAWGKNWVVIKFANGSTWIPSFEDLYRIITSICECEDEKYPPPEQQGRWYVLNFLIEAIKGKSFEELAKKYKLPIRNGNQIIDTNGAKVEDKWQIDE